MKSHRLEQERRPLSSPAHPPPGVERWLIRKSSKNLWISWVFYAVPCYNQTFPCKARRWPKLCISEIAIGKVFCIVCQSNLRGWICSNYPGLFTKKDNVESMSALKPSPSSDLALQSLSKATQFSGSLKHSIEKVDKACKTKVMNTALSSLDRSLDFQSSIRLLILPTREENTSFLELPIFNGRPR
ncbi:hypothetical protein LIER_07558 [Lithospermum erythrorhizon]|uniref:Uncharacterized protein n=1 Tax=Lithospermum erythrorhizon TaxID=34254 RepID=A0AAV3P8S6_LITER